MGFGTQILTRVAPSDLNGSAKLDHTPEGMSYTLGAPLNEMLEG
jgi:two-component sensor histidine kinase